MSDTRYADYASASSSSNNFNSTFSIPAEVDIALGDNQKSDASNWSRRRSDFLSKNYQETSLSFRNSLFLSQISVAAMRVIADCGQKMANAKANGVFIALDQISPNRDSFSVQMAFKTGGNPNWALTQFSVRPSDPGFNCNGGYEHASRDKPIKLDAMTAVINCSKSANRHLILAVDTTEGGGVAIQLDSIDEQIKKLRDDMTSQLQVLNSTISALSTFELTAPVRVTEGPPVGDATAVRSPATFTARFCAFTTLNGLTDKATCRLEHDASNKVWTAIVEGGQTCRVTCIK